MTVGIYIRVSTEDQVREGFSISAQREKLKAYCIAQDWNDFKFYVDEGISAKNTERPQLQLMMDHIKQGMITTVLVYRLDRLTRSVLDLYKLLETFDKYNCAFKSATEVYDTTTAMGRMFITIVAALAQWERENLGERVRMGQTEKARQGKWTPSTAPFGYYIDKENDSLVINEKEALIVKRIFNMYLEGYGMNKISVALNNENILTKKGELWREQSVKYIISNPIYIGKTRWNYRVNKENYFEIEGAVPPIITTDVYDKVQAVREKRKKAHPREATSNYIFSGVLKCARCGSKLVGKISNKTLPKKYSYYCKNKVRHLCDIPNTSEHYIEEKFLNIIGKWDIKEEVESTTFDENKNDFENEIKITKDELAAIDKRRKKWQYAWANDVINDLDFTTRMKEEDEKEHNLKKQLKDLQQTLPEVDADEFRQMLIDVKKNWKYMTTQEKKMFVQLTVRSITINRNGVKSVDTVILEGIELN